MGGQHDGGEHYAGHRSLSRVRVIRGSLHGYDVAGELCRVDRVVHYNPDGSQHRCNAACKHARGADCECSCGGRFHGIHRHSAGSNLSLL